MKAKVYLKMLACLVGLLTFYSCNNDLEQDKNASVEAQQVVKEAQNLRNLEALEKYLENPVKTTILVFCHKNGKLVRGFEQVIYLSI